MGHRVATTAGGRVKRVRWIKNCFYEKVEVGDSKFQLFLSALDWRFCVCADSSATDARPNLFCCHSDHTLPRGYFNAKC